MAFWCKPLLLQSHITILHFQQKYNPWNQIFMVLLWTFGDSKFVYKYLGPREQWLKSCTGAFPEMAEQKKVFLLKKLFLEFKSCCRYKIDLTMKGLEKWAHNLWLCLNYVLFDVTCPR